MAGDFFELALLPRGFWPLLIGLASEPLCRRDFALVALTEADIEAAFLDVGVILICVNGVVGSERSETGVSGLNLKRLFK